MIEKTILKNNLPTVALIGRANVGKSTFFNTLIDEKKALVSTIAGTTRNNNEGIIVWRGKEINITGSVEFRDVRFTYKKGKEILVNALFGLVIVLAAFAIVNTLIMFFASGSFSSGWWQVNC